MDYSQNYHKITIINNKLNFGPKQLQKDGNKQKKGLERCLRFLAI